MTQARLYALAAGLLLCSAASAENVTPQLKMNGFATAGVAWLDEDSGGGNHGPASYMQNSYGRQGISEDINTKFDSVVGLQFDYAVNDQTNLVTQLVARGQNQNSYQIQAEWAYIRYQLAEDWVVRGGRFSFPGFMFSDSMLIGYSHPWVRPPAEVYANTPVPSVQGLDVLYRKNVGDWTLGAQLFGGNADTSDGRLGLQNMGTLYLTATHDDLTIRGGHATFKLVNNVSLAPLQNLDSGGASGFSSLGMLFDNNEWLLAGEVVRQHVKDWPADFVAGYLTFGHYFGQWLPYATWSKIDTQGEVGKTQGPLNLRPSSIFEQTTYSLGLRYDPKPRFCIKAQIDHVTDIGKYDGIFRFTQTTGSGALIAGPAAPFPLKSANLYSLTASVVF